jgi:hypothetical protein
VRVHRRPPGRHRDGPARLPPAPAGGLTGARRPGSRQRPGARRRRRPRSRAGQAARVLHRHRRAQILVPVDRQPTGEGVGHRDREPDVGGGRGEHPEVFRGNAPGLIPAPNSVTTYERPALRRVLEPLRHRAEWLADRRGLRPVRDHRLVRRQGVRRQQGAHAHPGALLPGQAGGRVAVVRGF